MPIGFTPRGVRMIYNVKGGTVSGSNIKGNVLPPAPDWILLRPDGAGEIDVKLTIRTDDGELIYMYYRGILDITPEVFERIQKGESVDPSEYYFRTTPIFETGSDKYGWLNRIVAVGVGQAMPNREIYRIL